MNTWIFVLLGTFFLSVSSSIPFQVGANYTCTFVSFEDGGEIACFVQGHDNKTEKYEFVLTEHDEPGSLWFWIHLSTSIALCLTGGQYI
jgi:hypothetical protein